ncbi:MAG: HEAT repeat protein [Planctomycetota bacterium]
MKFHTAFFCVLPLAFACLSVSARAATATAQEGAEEAVDWSNLEIEEISAQIKKLRDEVDEGAVDALGARGTKEAMDLLLQSYETFASTYMRRQVLLALAEYDGVEGAFNGALTHLMQVSVGEPKIELREAAIRGLGQATTNGKPFLEKIITSTADDSIRERALLMHINMGSESDHVFYRGVYERTMKTVQEFVNEANEKKNRTKREREGLPDPEISWPTGMLRSTAMKAIIESLDDDALETAFEKDTSLSVRRVALEELERRESKEVVPYAREMVERVDFPGTARAMAARILVRVEGADVADDLIKIAVKNVTPAVLSHEIADLLADLKDEGVDKDLQKLIGKGRTPQKAFAIRATKFIEGDKFLKKMRKGLSAKEPELAAATVLALASRGDTESIKDMQKLLEKTKSDIVRESLLEALSTLHDGDNDWLIQLETYTVHEDDYLRNAALSEIARIGRSNSIDLMKERLQHPVWSTRLIALKSLADRRDASLLRPMIDQMQNEVGRMQLEFGDVLFNLTGQPFGRRASVWDRWLEDEGGAVELMEENQVEKLRKKEAERRLKEISSTAKEPIFFGIRIVSERVLFIVDVSGSMSIPMRRDTVSETPPTRMDVAKRELRDAIGSLPDGALFNIAPFSGSVMTWLDGGVATGSEQTRAEAQLWVSKLEAMGGTNLYESLVFAFNDPDVDTIYLLSDGEPSVGDLIDPQLIRDDIADRNQHRGMKINSISIGESLQVLKWLAEDSGGVYVEVQ